jgi:hypothetical protein
VRVVAEPSLADDVMVWVTSRGVDVVVSPRLLVVVTTNVEERVVLTEKWIDTSTQRE